MRREEKVLTTRLYAVLHGYTPYYTAQPAVLHGHALPALRAGRGGPGGGRLGAARACPPGRGSWGRFPPSGVWGGAPAAGDVIMTSSMTSSVKFSIEIFTKTSFFHPNFSGFFLNF